jgi:hypothetical protein
MSVSDYTHRNEDNDVIIIIIIIMNNSKSLRYKRIFHRSDLGLLFYSREVHGLILGLPVV